MPRRHGFPRAMRAVLPALCAAAMLQMVVGTAGAQTVREDFYVTNEPIYAEVLEGNTLYVGGHISSVSPASGGASTGCG